MAERWPPPMPEWFAAMVDESKLPDDYPEGAKGWNKDKGCPICLKPLTVEPDGRIMCPDDGEIKVFGT